MKKQPYILLSIELMILGLIFLPISIFGVVYSAIQQSFDYIFIPIITSIISLCPLIAALCIEIRRKYLKSFMIKGEKSTCVVEEYISSGDVFHHYVVVTYWGESGQMYSQEVYCDADDYNKFKKGTEIVCYIKGENCFVPNSSLSKRIYK